MPEIADIDFQIVRSEPNFWVSRVVIFRSVEPLDPIREIKLKKGLNIVWAKEENIDTGLDRISGHSAGKTSFCRLLRYCLGEEGFAHSLNQRRIRALFPEGYVAAEIYVAGKLWSIARPIGSRHRDYSAEGIPLEQIFNKDHAKFDVFKETLVQANLGDQSKQPGQFIRWEHVLAWCTRDQEARYQSVYQWRSPRSESGTPSFERPKADAMFVMRSVLGLLFENEVQLERDLDLKISQQTSLKAKIEEARKEPAYWHKHYRSVLESLIADKKLRLVPVQSENLFIIDLERQANEKIEELTKEIAELTGKKEIHDDRINGINKRLWQIESEIEKLQNHLTLLGEKSSTSQTEAEVFATMKKDIVDNSSKWCEFGNRSIGDCSYSQSYLTTLSITDGMNRAEFKKISANSAEEIRQTKDQLGVHEESAEAVKAELAGVKGEQKTITDSITGKEANKKDIQDSLKNLLKYSTAAEKIDETIIPLQTQLSNLEKGIEAEKFRIKALPKEKQNILNLLNATYDRVAKGVLSKNYEGLVQIKDGDLIFAINNPTVLAGEAMETLSILLADIASVLYSVFVAGNHPGFLLHDSPREADLGIGLYHKLFNFVETIEKQCLVKGDIPFQYIITTTSPPPPEMRESGYMALQLSAATEEDMLFRRDFLTQEEKQLHQPSLL